MKFQRILLVRHASDFLHFKTGERERMKSLRIGLFTDTFLPDQNGIVTSVCLLSEQLAARGHDVEIVAPDFPDYLDHRQDVRRVSSIRYTFLPTYRLAWPTRRHFEQRYDLIHTHTPLTLGLAGVRLTRKWNIPHIATYHTHLTAYTHYVPGLPAIDRTVKIVPRFVQQVYGKADAVITPSAEMVGDLQAWGVRRPIVIPTSIDPVALNGAPPVYSPWPEGTRRLLTVGRLAREKRFDLVLDALAQLPDAHLVILGEGPERLPLESHAARLGVLKRVTFMGVRPWTEIGAYYRQAELFLFASDSETQGLVLQEAQLMGVPVVAVGARGTLSSVQNGYSGYLVGPGDVPGLVQHAREVLGQPDLWATLSRNAREFGGRTTPAGVAEQVLRVYASVLGRRPEAVGLSAAGLAHDGGEKGKFTPATRRNNPAYDL